eukprot:5479902-Pleurochrysis_carterae.AAC.1
MFGHRRHASTRRTSKSSTASIGAPSCFTRQNLPTKSISQLYQEVPHQDPEGAERAGRPTCMCALASLVEEGLSEAQVQEITHTLVFMCQYTLLTDG